MELWSLGGQDEEVSGHVHDSSGMIQPLEHRGRSMILTSGAGFPLQARWEEGACLVGPTRVPRVAGH